MAAWHLFVAYGFYSVDILSLDDALFDSDARTNHIALAHGWSRRTIVHPHLANFFSIPIWVFDLVVSNIADITDRERFR